MQSPTKGVIRFMDGYSDTLYFLYDRVIIEDLLQFGNVPLGVVPDKCANFGVRVGNTIFGHTHDLN